MASQLLFYLPFFVIKLVCYRFNVDTFYSIRIGFVYLFEQRVLKKYDAGKMPLRNFFEKGQLPFQRRIGFKIGEQQNKATLSNTTMYRCPYCLIVAFFKLSLLFV